MDGRKEGQKEKLWRCKMISVIVPIYDVEKYLPKCIESIINQTYKDLQIILVDDGSPDSCPQICNEYAKLDLRIEVIHQENSGVSAARNAGLKIAKGEYIGFVDPDDWIEPDMYSAMLTSMIENEAELVVCGYNYYDENGMVDDKRIYAEKPNEVLTQKDVMRMFSDMPPSIRHGVVQKLFLKKYINSLLFDSSLKSSEDVLFLNEYVLKIEKAVFVHKPFYCNVVRNGSATHGGLNIKSLYDSFAVHEKMYLDSVKLYPDLKNHALAFLMDVFLLKYGMAKKSYEQSDNVDKERNLIYLQKMKKYVKKYAFKALTDSEIYWKTRIYYCVL